MATTNFALFREKLAAQQSANTKKTGTNWFKATPGVTHSFRFLPLKSQNLELPIEFYHHHAITMPDGKFESFGCRQRRGEGDCPFCRLATESYKKFVKTDNEDYKNAFKQLVAKSHYLLVGYEKDKLDLANLTEKDLWIVRASSKTSMEQLETALAKGRDFVDFVEGREIELRKPATKADLVAIIWEFQDSSVAFTKDEGGKNTWDKLVELSPDLTSIVSSPSDEKLAELLARYTSSPVISEPVVNTSVGMGKSNKTTKLVTREPEMTSNADDDFDLEALRAECSRA